MVKTLAIKFQVAGVKEAQAALNSYKNSLNQLLTLNKQAVNKSLKDATDSKRFAPKIDLNKGAKSEVSSNDARVIPPERGEVLYDYVQNYQRTLAFAKNKQYGAAAELICVLDLIAFWGDILMELAALRAVVLLSNQIAFFAIWRGLKNIARQ